MERNVISPDGQMSVLALGQSLRYHGRRVRFFEQVERVCLAVLLFFVAGSAVQIVRFGLGPWILGLLMAVPTTVFFFATWLDSQSRRHRHLLARWTQLDMWATGTDMTRDNTRHLTQEVEQIMADEPPRLRVLDALCHHAQCQAMGYPDEALTVSRLQRWCAPAMDIRAKTLRATSSATEPTPRHPISGRRR
ncbi:hypothetical protein [Yersinia intermedia]|uniref:hypothetical protein n=1 Tax=Yersinia intermedia TaxID=631 RepID=UPI00119E0038|nr:hypothetical protein [Yersinia intermedia]